MVAITISLVKTKRNKTDKTHPDYSQQMVLGRMEGRANLSQILDENGDRAGQRYCMLPDAFVRISRVQEWEQKHFWMMLGNNWKSTAWVISSYLKLMAYLHSTLPYALEVPLADPVWFPLRERADTAACLAEVEMAQGCHSHTTSYLWHKEIDKVKIL